MMVVSKIFSISTFLIFFILLYAQDFVPHVHSSEKILSESGLSSSENALLENCKYNISIFVYDLDPSLSNPFKNNGQEDMYSTERRILNAMQMSNCRTWDPDNADFYFVPVAPTEIAHEYLGKSGAELNAGFNFLDKVYQHIHQKFPFFNRSQGTDHIWAISHDIGSCLAPPEILNGIFLQHYGDKVHNKDCLLTYLNKSSTPPHPGLMERASSPCYDPAKDIVVPPYTGNTREMVRWEFDATASRPVLAHFRGGVRQERCYSNGIRQWLTSNLSAIHGFSVHTEHINQFAHRLETLKATFCLCPGGWVGWSQRAYQVMSAGCIPVFFEVQGRTDHAFQNLLDYDRFAVRLRSTGELNSFDLQTILMSIESSGEAVQMKRNLQHNWKYFTYDNVHEAGDLDLPKGSFDLILISLHKKLIHRQKIR
mmetsp:Transcript_16789/g.21774  ORF Transcript_16789/g.21774 Transcript_16789/m.21774 type:complete len:425 (-) Transcript_16789:129-1403(-)